MYSFLCGQFSAPLGKHQGAQLVDHTGSLCLFYKTLATSYLKQISCRWHVVVSCFPSLSKAFLLPWNPMDCNYNCSHTRASNPLPLSWSTVTSNSVSTPCGNPRRWMWLEKINHISWPRFEFLTINLKWTHCPPAIISYILNPFTLKFS